MTSGREAWERLTRPVRALRSALRRWSSASDREFHDRLFDQLHYDPFSKSYPGYLTIRRFADHLEGRLDGVRSVVDLGCGPGEITCEIARRRPDLTVIGIDHSSTAIAKATGNAAKLGVTNVSFRVGDLESYRPDAPVDLVAMFDSFHHLLDPQGLIDRVAPHCPRMLLIEPAGMWTGQWNRRVDLDWLPLTVSQIRQRLEYQFGVGPPDTGPAKAGHYNGPAKAGHYNGQAKAGHHITTEAHNAEPTENRYALADFQRFFSGWAVEVHGTIAGLQDYGPQDGRASAVRDRFGDVTYDVVVALEKALRQSALDLAAKHWVIFADRTKPAGMRAVVPSLPARPAMQGLLPPYGASYTITRAPETARAREVFSIDVRVKNTGWMAWSADASQPVFLSYHWLDATGQTVVREGLRTAMPVVQSGEEVPVVLKVEAPERAGSATLSIELVHEGVTWFAEQGVTPATVAMRVTPPAEQ